MARSRPRQDRGRPQGWDTVKTPFGYRTVPKGRGWEEAGKWAILRLVAQAILWGTIIILAWIVLTRIAFALRP